MRCHKTTLAELGETDVPVKHIALTLTLTKSKSNPKPNPVIMAVFETLAITLMWASAHVVSKQVLIVLATNGFNATCQDARRIHSSVDMNLPEGPRASTASHC